MSNGHEHLGEDLAAYALDSLPAARRTQVEAHVEVCPECAGLLVQYRAVLGVLPMALTPETPPGEAWPVILDRVRRRPRSGGDRWARLAGRIRPLRWPAVAALAAGLLLWNVQAQRELTRLRAPSLDVEQLARTPARVVTLAGTGVPGASARLYVTTDGQRGNLAVTGLAPLPPGRTYQLWFARPGQATVTGGAFQVNAQGQAVAPVIIPAPLEEVRAIAVTEEPAPASPAPTGTHLLDAQPWP